MDVNRGSSAAPMLFGEFVDAYGSLAREEFTARFPHPFIEAHFKSVVPDPASLSATSTADREEISLPDSRAHWHYAMLYQVAKSAHNPASGHITIGRAAANDVVIPHGAISKVHAVLKKEPGTGSILVYDAESKFGTAVDGRKLGPGDSAPVKSGGAVVLAGCVHLLFFSSKDFYDYMRLKLRTGKTRIRRAPGPASPS